VARIAVSKESLKVKVRLPPAHPAARDPWNDPPGCAALALGLLQGSLHMIHGLDLARAILAVHAQFDKAAGQRWILTDGRVYDWWDLASAWGSGGEQSRGSADGPHGPQSAWVQQFMQEQGLRALPRNVELLGRALDSREFWTTFELSPAMARLESP
jgi:hypothetical protein